MATLSDADEQAPPQLDDPRAILDALLELREGVEDEGRRLFDRWRPGLSVFAVRAERAL